MKTRKRDGIDSDVPSEGQLVCIRAWDHQGLYVVPFPVQFKDGAWFNPQTNQRLECDVADWMPWELSAARFLQLADADLGSDP